jgi:hypothetical protein
MAIREVMPEELISRMDPKEWTLERYSNGEGFVVIDQSLCVPVFYANTLDEVNIYADAFGRHWTE